VSSPRNRWAERVLAARPQLTAEEHRLAWALDRLVLGFRQTSERLGDQLLRETTGLHGRSLERTRRRLVERGLVRYKAGRGRGNRSWYELVLDEPETPAPERDFPRNEKTAQKPAEKTAQKPAPERARSKEVGPGCSYEHPGADRASRADASDQEEQEPAGDGSVLHAVPTSVVACVVCDSPYVAGEPGSGPLTCPACVARRAA